MKYLNEKEGFTLLELLAVIVLLSVIAVITMPIMLNIISNIKREAKETSAIAALKAVQNYYTRSQLSSNENERLPLTVTFPSNLINISGENPTSGMITMNTDGTYIITNLIIGEYVCNIVDEEMVCVEVQ